MVLALRHRYTGQLQGRSYDFARCTGRKRKKQKGPRHLAKLLRQIKNYFAAVVLVPETFGVAALLPGLAAAAAV